MPIHVKRPGLLSTIQDLGRYQYAHLGISVGGAADRMACRIANRIVGNEENDPVLEMTLMGAALEFDQRGVIALMGAACEASIGNRSIPLAFPIEVAPGEILSCGSIKGGARTYLAVRGGWDIPKMMGSASTHIGGGFGGIHGRSLRAEDVLNTGKDPHLAVLHVDAGMLDSLYSPGPIRLTRGPQHNWFGPSGFETLLAASYSVSEHSNRAGLRLNGPAVHRTGRTQLLTEGTSLGAIQVPEDGYPIILFVDQQTTGGYPKIANVIAADMHRVAQLRPRQEVAFEEVSIPQATGYLWEQERYLASILYS